MKIELAKKLPTEGVTVFVLKEGDPVRTHPFFRLYTEEERKHLEFTLSALSINASSTKFFILPTGRKILIVGVAARNKFNNRKAILAARRVIVATRGEKIKQLAVLLEDFQVRTSPQDTATMLGTQFKMANFEFVKYKTTPREGWNFVEQATII